MSQHKSIYREASQHIQEKSSYNKFLIEPSGSRPRGAGSSKVLCLALVMTVEGARSTAALIHLTQSNKHHNRGLELIRQIPTFTVGYSCLLWQSFPSSKSYLSPSICLLCVCVSMCVCVDPQGSKRLVTGFDRYNMVANLPAVKQTDKPGT